MKNIGILVNSLQGGGAERCAADLSIFFSEHGYNVTIVTDLSIDRKYEYSGQLVNFCYDIEKLEGKLLGELWGNKIDELATIKKKYKLDICISFMQITNYLNILSRGKEKVILTTHSLNSEYAKNSSEAFWAKDTFTDIYQFADCITFPSLYCQNDWIKHYGDKNKITLVVNNPVHRMNELDISKENFIITVGRMQPIKRQWLLLRVFKLVKEQYANCKLIILGDGELKNQLMDLASELKIEESILMPGNVTNVEYYLNLSKIFVLTSRFEAMPCSVLEAFSVGLPIVTCDIPGGIREEVDVIDGAVSKNKSIVGKCGIITPYIEEYYQEDCSDEEHLMAEEIVRLLKNDELRERLGKNAKEKAKEYDIEQIGNFWIKEIIENASENERDWETFDRVKRKSLSSWNKAKESYTSMHNDYCKALEKWTMIKKNNQSLYTYFVKNKITSIIIYGLGKMGNQLIEELKQSNIRIVCAIDKRAINMYRKYPVITGESKIPMADCIIITPVYECEKIKQMLSLKTDVPIILLKDIITEIAQI